MFGQDGGVAGGGGGVAADVDQAAGGHPQDGVQGGLVAAFAGRVDDDDVGREALGGKAAGGLAGVGTEKAALGLDGGAHPGGVGFGALDGFGDDLDPHQGAAARRHRQADGAHPAVEVEQQVAGGGVGVVGGHRVELLGAGGVDLVEGEGPQPHRHPAQAVLDKTRPVQGHIFAAQDDVGLVPVDVDEDGRNVGKAAAQPRGDLFGVGQAGPGADQADHDLAAVRPPPQEDVPHQALAAALVVGGDAIFGEQLAESGADLIEDGGLQQAVPAGDDPVAAPGVKADAGPAVFAPPHRVLHLVAVAVDLRGGEDGRDRHLQPADPAEGVGHRLLLGLQLSLVADVPQGAAAAGAGHRAAGGDTVGGGGEHILHDAEGVPAAVLDHLRPDDVAGGGARHKDRLALPMADAAALAGQPLDGQGDDLIFL